MAYAGGHGLGNQFGSASFAEFRLSAPRWPEAECLHENTSQDQLMTIGGEDSVAVFPVECVDCGKVFEP